MCCYYVADYVVGVNNILTFGVIGYNGDYRRVLLKTLLYSRVYRKSIMLAHFKNDTINNDSACYQSSSKAIEGVQVALNKASALTRWEAGALPEARTGATKGCEGGKE